jgi:hypothetical protein
MINEREIDIGKDVWGHAFEIDLSAEIKTEKEAFSVLDQFCAKRGLNQLSDTWNTINFSKAAKLLQDCLSHDIAFSSYRISEEKTVATISENILSRLNTSNISFCFSNCFGTPWELIVNGYSFNALTEQTLDIGVVLIDDKKIIFAYFMSED